MKSTSLAIHSSGWGQVVPHAEMVAGGIIVVGFGAVVAGFSIFAVTGTILATGFLVAHVFSLSASK